MKKIFLSLALVCTFLIAVSFADSKDITIINKSGVNVISITISSTGDVSGSQTFSSSIGDGQKSLIGFEVTGEQCLYEVRFTGQDGKQYLMTDVELCNSTEIILETNKADEVPGFFQKTK